MQEREHPLNGLRGERERELRQLLTGFRAAVFRGSRLSDEERREFFDFLPELFVGIMACVMLSHGEHGVSDKLHDDGLGDACALGAVAEDMPHGVEVLDGDFAPSGDFHGGDDAEGVEERFDALGDGSGAPEVKSGVFREDILTGSRESAEILHELGKEREGDSDARFAAGGAEVSGSPVELVPFHAADIAFGETGVGGDDEEGAAEVVRLKGVPDEAEFVGGEDFAVDGVCGGEDDVPPRVGDDSGVFREA